MNAEISRKIEETMHNVLRDYNEQNVESTLSHFYFDENFLAYLLNESQIASKEEYRSFLETEFNQMPPLEIHILNSRVSVYRTMATFFGECVLSPKVLDDDGASTVEVTAEGNVFTLNRINIENRDLIPVRFTAVLREFNDSWKINQLHFSSMSMTRAA